MIIFYVDRAKAVAPISKFLNLSRILLIACLGYGCTENPIGDNEITFGNRQITGTVQLSNNGVADNVYVWLEGFDLGTRTDEQGKFQLVLPLPSAQGTASGVSGAFLLYYYVSNFQLATTQVFTQNGFFVYSTDEINADGELIQPKFLIQKLIIDTRVQPSSYSNAEVATTPSLLRIDVRLQAINDSVAVFFPGLVGSTFGPLIFRNVESNEVTVSSSAVSGLVTSPRDTITVEPTIRTMSIRLGSDNFSPGTYEVIPYVLVEDGGVPNGLFNSLGSRVLEFGPDYLLLPIVREGEERFVTVTQ